MSGASTCASTSVILRCVSGSSPFDALTTRAPAAIPFDAAPITPRTACDGAAEITSSAPPTAAKRSVVAVSEGLSGESGRNRSLR